jgi:predicted LPLAT superfamily acyltransferase
MPLWQGKSRGNRLGYSIFVYLIRNFGVQPAYLLLRFVSLYYWFFSWTSSGHIYRYFRERHGMPALKAWFKVYSNYFIFGQTILDRIVVMAGIENRFTYHFDGEERLREMVGNGKGGILLSAHVGNWEAAGHLLKRLNTTVHVVMFDGEHERIKAYMTEVTGGRNVNVITIRNDMSHVYAIGEALRQNDLVCLHADRFLEGNKTETFSLLGKDAKFPAGPFQLAAAFGVPVCIVFAFKESDTHYHFYGSPLIQRSEIEAKPEFVRRLMQTFAAEFEQKIKRYPDQWFNYYDFWQ